MQLDKSSSYHLGAHCSLTVNRSTAYRISGLSIQVLGCQEQPYKYSYKPQEVYNNPTALLSTPVLPRYSLRIARRVPASRWLNHTRICCSQVSERAIVVHVGSRKVTEASVALNKGLCLHPGENVREEGLLFSHCSRARELANQISKQGVSVYILDTL